MALKQLLICPSSIYSGNAPHCAGLLPTRVAARSAWSAAHDILDRSTQRVSSLVECVATLWDQKLVLPLPSQARDSLKGLFESAAQTQVTTLKARVATDQGRLVELGDDAMLQGNAVDLGNIFV
jgi:hypothetical protein